MAVIGIYGVKAYVVARRTREIGIRLALGATSGDVFWPLLCEGFTLTGIGLAIPLGQVLESVLVDVNALDPLVFAAAPALLATAAILASYLPGRRATRLTPMTALRDE